MNSPNPTHIEYGLYTAADADAMAELLAETFSRNDPPAWVLGVTAADFESFVRLFLPKAAEEKLTIVARLAGTGELVGALLTEDCASTMPEGVALLSPKFEPIFDILGQLDTEYRAGREVRPGEYVHLFLLGVSSRAAGQGIAKRLVAACLENAAQRGYRTAVCEATNKTSQHIFRTLGFAERVHRSYAAHRFNGQAMFASIAEQGGPILMDRSLVG
ncbi:MAG: GNAT family N-acetyltransferase [Acidobacteriales bacterium]|nr:GNAT family N-acetyltransferase [Terriglobales bacterium]